MRFLREEITVPRSTGESEKKKKEDREKELSGRA